MQAEAFGIHSTAGLWLCVLLRGSFAQQVCIGCSALVRVKGASPPLALEKGFHKTTHTHTLCFLL